MNQRDLYVFLDATAISFASIVFALFLWWVCKSVADYADELFKDIYG